jgi:hypothetical protein
MKKEPEKRALSHKANRNWLEFFEEIACRAGDVYSAGCTALAVLHTLHDAGRFGALRTVGALVGIHYLLTVAGLGNLRHNACSPCCKSCATNVAAHALNVRSAPYWANGIETS